MRQRKIIKYENYVIYENGVVVNTQTNRKISVYQLKGYNYCRLWKNNKVAHFSIHRLLMQHFTDSYKEELHVNHKNGVRDDNRLENLEMVTRAENMQHAWDTGLRKPAYGDNNKSTKISDEGIAVILSNPEIRGVEFAKLFDVTEDHISRIRNGKRRKNPIC